MKMQKRFDEKCLAFLLIMFDLVAVNCPYYYHNTHSWQSVNLLTSSLKISDMTE